MIELTCTKPADVQWTDKASSSLNSFLQRKDLGFHLIDNEEELWKHSNEHGKNLRERYDRLVIVGIGGSSLGPKCLVKALATFPEKVEFLDNVDGLELERILARIPDFEKTHWLFISKSGGTLETLTILDFVDQHLSEKSLQLSNHATVISEPVENHLTDWAKEKNVPILHLPKNIGGRYSVFTPVGMLPAAFCGMNLDGFREGIRWALKNQNFIRDLVAQSLSSFERKEWIHPFWIYSTGLSEGARWIQQLWAESLAKKVDRKGGAGPQVSTPLPLVGSIDQHSVLQQMSEGVERKFIWFVRISDCEEAGPKLSGGSFLERTKMADRKLGHLLGAFASSTQKALNEVGTESLSLKLSGMNEASVGALLMSMMLTVAALGEALDINAFDQPGVELGKKLVHDFL